VRGLRPIAFGFGKALRRRYRLKVRYVAMKAAALAVAALATLLLLALSPASAQEGWVIHSMDTRYEIAPSGQVAVTEDLAVDFGSLQQHGIFRDIPIRYAYDDQHDRLSDISDVTVDDGANAIPFELISSDANLRIKIGDPDKLVTGRQRYRINYKITGALNPFPDHDELYWNITGNAWPVTIEAASAGVFLPGPGGIQNIACYQGLTGSTDPCKSTTDPVLARGGHFSATFAASHPLSPGEGLTVAVGITKGVIDVGPPVLVDKEKTGTDAVLDYFRVTPLSVALTFALAAALLAVILRLWWAAGRDRWYGDMAHADLHPQSRTRPLFAHETLVVEYQPPEAPVSGTASRPAQTPLPAHGEVSNHERSEGKRRLRPAEIGVLIDERADTLDVSATIVDLAVRKYLLIKEVEEGGVFGLFKTRDYELQRLEPSPGDLLPYESTLLTALFESGDSVRLKDLKNKFYTDLADVKKELYHEATDVQHFFARNPETIRNIYRVAGLIMAGVGVAGVFLLGSWLGGGIVAIPLVIAGLVLAVISGAMPRRTAEGRRMYRRSLGFRLFMVTAEKERQRFAEQQNIFSDYLPYAIVFQCVKKWAKAFEDLGIEPSAPVWYVGTGAFIAADFADGMSDFSSSISNVMASTPGGHGGSGFGGGGGSGGGGGGGGGGAW
jgi:uncharacterized membrane protein YgcG